MHRPLLSRQVITVHLYTKQEYLNGRQMRGYEAKPFRTLRVSTQGSLDDPNTLTSISGLIPANLDWGYIVLKTNLSQKERFFGRDSWNTLMAATRRRSSVVCNIL